MQILQWLFRVTHEQPREEVTSSSTNQKQHIHDKVAKSKDIVVSKHQKSYQRSKRAKNFKLFTFICTKDVAKACFYSTIHLKRPQDFHRRQHSVHSMKMKKEDIARGLNMINKSDSNTHSSGNKVLPINAGTLPSPTSTNEQYNALEKREKVKGDKTRTLSRMKELLRWAAAAKAEKGGKFIGRKVLQFRNRAALKPVPDDDELNIESPKISFRWEVESCSTTSSAYSAISLASSSKTDQTRNLLSLNSTPLHGLNHCSTRKGNWITTDSEFVVLEL